MTQSHDKLMKQSGSAVVFVLIAIVVVAIGALALMSDKFKPQGAGSEDEAVASAENGDAVSIPAQKNPVIATVNGLEIKRQDAVEMMNNMPPQLRAIPAEQLFPIAVEQLIANKVVDEKAGNAGLEKDPEVLAQLEKAKQQIIRTKYLENVAEEAVTPEAVDAAYQNYVDNFESVPEVKAAHILVDNEKTAKDIIVKLGKGAEFSELAAEYSKDGTAQNGGDLGYFSQNAVVPEFGKAAFALEAGEYTKTPVKTAFGYHVIKLDDKRDQPAATLEEVKTVLENDIRRKALDTAIVAWRSDFDIERFDINGNPLNASEPASGEAVQDTEPEAGMPEAMAEEAAEEAAPEAQEAPAAE